MSELADAGEHLPGSVPLQRRASGAEIAPLVDGAGATEPETRVSSAACISRSPRTRVYLAEPEPEPEDTARGVEMGAQANAAREAARICAKLGLDMYDVKRGCMAWKQAKLQVSQMGGSVFDKKGE